MDVVREPVVIELFEPFATRDEAAGEAADLVVPFQHRDVDPAPTEFVSRGQAAKAGTDHDHVGLRSFGHRERSRKGIGDQVGVMRSVLVFHCSLCEGIKYISPFCAVSINLTLAA